MGKQPGLFATITFVGIDLIALDMPGDAPGIALGQLVTAVFWPDPQTHTPLAQDLRPARGPQHLGGVK